LDKYNPRDLGNDAAIIYSTHTGHWVVTRASNGEEGDAKRARVGEKATGFAYLERQYSDNIFYIIR
jgi:hypothetical protein